MGEGREVGDGKKRGRRTDWGDQNCVWHSKSLWEGHGQKRWPDGEPRGSYLCSRCCFTYFPRLQERLLLPLSGERQWGSHSPHEIWDVNPVWLQNPCSSSPSWTPPFFILENKGLGEDPDVGSYSPQGCGGAEGADSSAALGRGRNCVLWATMRGKGGNCPMRGFLCLICNSHNLIFMKFVKGRACDSYPLVSSTQYIGWCLGNVWNSFLRCLFGAHLVLLCTQF